MTRDAYIERWTRLTKDSLKIFAGNQAFAHLTVQGMIEVPISSISHVQRVKYDINAKSKALQGTHEN